MSIILPEKDVLAKKVKNTSRHCAEVPPQNPNKRPTTINMKRTIGRMREEDLSVIRRTL